MLECGAVALVDEIGQIKIARWLEHDCGISPRSALIVRARIVDANTYSSGNPFTAGVVDNRIGGLHRKRYGCGWGERVDYVGSRKET